MNEEEFLNSIDCCFPYEDERKWRALILQGKNISANASFGVLEEIARKPYGNQVSEGEQLEMIDVWKAENKHPLAQSVIEAAKAIVTNKDLPVSRALELMSEVQAYHNQYCALNIIYFACDDVENLADQKQQKIVELWQEKD